MAFNPIPEPRDPPGDPVLKPKGSVPIEAVGRDESATTMAEQGRPVTVAYGTCKLPIYIIEKLVALQQDPPAWTLSTVYTLGQVVSNGGNAYECTVGGTSASSGGPSGTGSAISDGTVTWKYRQQLPCPIYFQRFIGALCEGQAAAGVNLFWDKEIIPAVNGTLFARAMELKLAPDAGGQTLPLAYDQTAYQHTVLIAPLNTAIGMPSGTQKEVPNIAIELQAVMFGAATADVSPADIVNDLITHARRGAGLPTSRVDASITGTAAGGMRVYCDAAGLRISMAIDAQKSGLDWINQVFKAVNVDWLWDGGAFWASPLGDVAIASPVYGATGYVPSNTVQFNLTADDFLDKLNPVSWDRRPDPECFNNVPVEYINRARGYATQTEEAPDALDVEKRGGKVSASTASLGVIFPDGVRPVMLSQIWTQRSLKVRNTYRFRLSWKYMALRPGDLVTLTDTVQGFSLVPVRITSFEEGEDGTIQFTAEDYPAAVQAAVPYAPQAGDGIKDNLPATTQTIPTQTPSDEFTHKNFVNLWPNPTSEAGPPTTFTPPGDGTNAEYDFRFNAGAGAFAGDWVRKLIVTSASTISISKVAPASSGQVYFFSARYKFISDVGASTIASVAISWLDASKTFITGQTFVLDRAQTTWSNKVTAGFLAGAPNGTAYVVAQLSLQTGAPGTAEVWFDELDFSKTINTDDILGGAVTRSKLAAVGQQVSSSCGAANTTSGTYADITNLAATLTTTGRPVMLILQPDGNSATASSISISTSAQTARIAFYRDSTLVQEFRTGGVTATGTWFSPQMVALDAPAAGTYTYKVRAMTTGGAQVNITDYVLVAYEL